MDYHEQAAEFLHKVGTTIKVEFNRQGKYFDGDKEERDIYDVTLKRESRSYTFAFGQSINCSGRFWKYGDHKQGISQGRQTGIPGVHRPFSCDWDNNKGFAAPSAYNVLSCLTKYDPGSFEDFCGEFGYDTDSRSAEKTYQAVKNEYSNLCRLFTDAELELMQEIQ